MTDSAQRDREHMRRAITLARRGRRDVAPNPRVGAVVVRDGERIAEGYHRLAGEAHAERDALSRLEAGAARGATLYVTLEPCRHHGRTPPCVDAIVEAGIRRVVCGHRDPNPKARGGVEALRQRGIEVEVGVLAEECALLNLGFLLSILHGRPAVRLKWAMTLDGKIATVTGESQWISSPAGRRWALGLREENDAIVVGSGTVLADDPRLNRRSGTSSRPIVRVVLDRRLRTPPEARLFSVDGPVLVYAASPSPREVQRLEAVGATVLSLGAGGLREVLDDLGARGVQEVLVEGGGEVLAAFVAEQLFERVSVCCAPLMLGGAGAPSPLGGAGRERLSGAPRLTDLRVRRRGPDVILEGIREGCLPDLLSSVAG